MLAFRSQAWRASFAVRRSCVHVRMPAADEAAPCPPYQCTQVQKQARDRSCACIALLTVVFEAQQLRLYIQLRIVLLQALLQGFRFLGLSGTAQLQQL